MHPFTLIGQLILKAIKSNEKTNGVLKIFVQLSNPICSVWFCTQNIGCQGYVFWVIKNLDVNDASVELAINDEVLFDKLKKHLGQPKIIMSWVFTVRRF